MRKISTIARTLTVAGIFSLLLIGCGHSKKAKQKLTPFQSAANQVLGQMAYGVADARRGFSRSSSRGFTDVLGSPSLYQGTSAPYPTDMNSDVRQCVNQVQTFPRTGEAYLMMASVLTQCLDRLLIHRNPLMTWAFRNLDPQTAEYFAYLMNWRGNGALPGMSGFGTGNVFDGLLLGSNPISALGGGSPSGFGF